MAALMMIYQAMPMLRFTESQIKQTNKGAQRVAKTQSLDPRWTTVQWLCTMAALMMIYQAMDIQDGQSYQIPYQTTILQF